MKSPARRASADRKREIEQAVLALAHTHGPENVSTGMIAAQLGVTQPAIYKHFKRKEDIWRAVARRLAEQIRANILVAGSPEMPPVAALKLLVLGHLELLGENPALPEIMTMRRKGKPKERNVFQAIIQSAMADFHKMLAQKVERAVRDNTFRRDLDPGDAASLLLGLIQSLVLRMLVMRNPDIAKRDGERLLNLLLAGFSETGVAK